MIKPVILDTRRRNKVVQRYFKNQDVDNIEIIGKILWAETSSNMILDYLVVKLAKQFLIYINLIYLLLFEN